MYGAILGDIIGSPYEFDRGNKTKDFPLFSEKSHFTDDTVMTIAVADAFLSLQQEGHGAKSKLIASLKEYGRKFPNAGYGTGFARWLFLGGKEPYNSWGNGSAMRVSGAAWLYEDIEAVRAAARLSAEVTHNHPEGIKGAETTAAAITAFLEGESFEDVIRTAVSLGGDCDTLTCIAGAIAEGFYGVPEELKQECRNRLPEELRMVLERFDQVIGRN